MSDLFQNMSDIIFSAPERFSNFRTARAARLTRLAAAADIMSAKPQSIRVLYGKAALQRFSAPFCRNVSL